MWHCKIVIVNRLTLATTGRCDSGENAFGRTAIAQVLPLTNASPSTLLGAPMRFPTDVKYSTTSQCLQCSYNACMPAVTIRDVPDDTRDMLASRAAQRGQSLQEYLRNALIDLASQADIGEPVSYTHLTLPTILLV